jgi:hypothetical protein
VATVKTDREIEDGLRNNTIEHDRFDSHFEFYAFRDGYSKAQKDLLAEASEGFEEWISKGLPWTGMERGAARDAWQAANLSIMKKEGQCYMDFIKTIPEGKNKAMTVWLYLQEEIRALKGQLEKLE